MRKAARLTTAAGLLLAIFSATALAASAESDLRYAKGLVNNQEYELAVSAFERFLKSYPRHAGTESARYLLAVSRYQLAGAKRTASESNAIMKIAASELEKFVSDYPRSSSRADALYYVSRARSKLALHQKAAEAATQYVAAFPKGKRVPEMLFWRGVANYSLKKYAMARRDWMKLVGQFPADPYVPQAHHFTAWSYLDQGKTDEAVAHFQVVVKRHASDPALAAKSQLKTAEAYLDARRYAQAREAFAVLAARFPEHQVEEREFGVARCLFAQDLFTDAAGAFERFASAHPGSPLLSHALYNAGLANLRAGKPQRSLTLFARTEKDESLTGAMKARAVYSKGLCYLRLEQYRDAAKAFRKAMGMGDQHWGRAAALKLGEAHEKAGDADAALKAYDSIVRISPESPEAVSALYKGAVLAKQTGDLRGASARIKKLIDGHPKADVMSDALFAAGEVFFAGGDYPRAATYYARLVKQFPRDKMKSEAMWRIGWCGYLLDKKDTAKAAFSLYVGSHPEGAHAAEAQYLIGVIDEQAGRPKEAEKSFLLLLQAYPKSDHAPHALLALGRVLSADERFEEAVKHFRRFAGAYPRHDLYPQAAMLLADALGALNRYVEAIAVYDKLAAHPKAGERKTRALLGKAWALMKAGRLGESTAAYKSILKSGPDDATLAEASYYLGVIARIDKRYKDAAGHFSRALANSPPGGRYRDHAAYRVGMCMYEAGDHVAAAEKLAAFTRDFPKSDDLDNAYYDLAWAHKRLRNSAAERAAWQGLVGATKDAARASEAHFGIGSIDFAAEQYQRAESSFARAAETAREAEGDVDKALYMVGLSRLKQAKNAAAVEAFMQLAKEAPRSEYAPVALNEVARKYLETGKHRDAEELLTKLLADYPAFKHADEAVFRLAEARKALGKWGEALKSYKELLQKHPKSDYVRQAHLGAGETSGNLGAYADAIASFRKAIGEDVADSLSAKAQYGIGEALSAQGKHVEAKEAFYRVVVLYPFSIWPANARYRLALSAEAAGKTDEAVRYYQDFLRRHPKNDHASEAKERLAKLSGENK